MFATLWQFGEVEAVVQRLRPLNAYGRQALARRQLLTDPSELNLRYDRIDRFLALLARQPDRADQLRHHLRHIPLLPSDFDVLGSAELFLVKKFLIHTKALAELLGPEVCPQFGLQWQSDALFAALDTGGSEQETFYVADRCSGELAATRRELRRLDRDLATIRSATLNTLKTSHGLDFEHRDFLVIDSQQVSRLSGNDVYLEPFDSRHTIARPVFPREHFQALAAREPLLARERQLEAAIIADLATAVHAQADTLQVMARAVEAIDVALAAAELAVSLRMTRPQLASPGSPLQIAAGRLVPLEENCTRQQLAYRPLSVCTDMPHVLLHGSNMSGKSVVLKTVSALQVLAQLGLFVPAERFRTIVFHNMFFIGGFGTEDARGLSSFGLEITSLTDALASHGRPILLVIDELARTTNSREGTALLAGLLHYLNGTDGAYSLTATHYVGLPALQHVQRYRMKGLDWAKVVRPNQAHLPESRAERIQHINQCMAYEMIPDTGGPEPCDAIGIAEMLGLDARIVEFARRQARQHPQETL